MSSETPAQSGEMSNKLIAGRYRLGKTLGKGTFGTVYFGEDIKFDPPRTVAVKLLHTQYLGDAQSREDIRREASVLARFHHPNILRVSDFEIAPDMAYIVTDFAEGGSLMKKIRPDPGAPPIPMPLEEVIYYLEQIASALDEAHNLGLIHRDIKPLNILLDRAGRPLLADFGLATILSGSTSSMVTDLTASGTPLYMAPEQWAGRAGKASDIYALGVVTYQLITGLPPYIGNQSALWAQHTGAPIPPLREKAPWLDYPPSLDAVIAGALAKDDRERTRPAGEFARRFKSALMGSSSFQMRIQQPPAFLQPGSNQLASGTGPPPTPYTNQPSSMPPGSFPSGQGYGQFPGQTNQPGAAVNQSQPGQGTGPLSQPTAWKGPQGPAPASGVTNPISQPQSWMAPSQGPITGGSIPPASQVSGQMPVQSWQSNSGPTMPFHPPANVNAWQGGPYATPQGLTPGGNAQAAGPVVTKKRGGVNLLALVAGVLALLVVAAVAGLIFLLPKGDSTPTAQAAANVTNAAGATTSVAGATTGSTNSGSTNQNSVPGAPTANPATATARALVGTGDLQVTVTESNEKAARAGDVTIRVFADGGKDALETAYNKADAVFHLKPGLYTVEADYPNDVTATAEKVEIKEGQPVKQTINLGVGQVQVDVVEATGRAARDGDVTMIVYKESDTSKPVTTVYSRSKAGIYLKPGSYVLETNYSNDVSQTGSAFQVTEGQVVTQSVNLQVGTAQVEVYETDGRVARDGDMRIRVFKKDDPNTDITNVYSRAKPNITLKEGTYELEINYASSVKVTSSSFEIKAGQTVKQVVNMEVGTVQLEAQLADGTAIDESKVIFRVYQEGNPNEVIATVYSKAKASVSLIMGNYEVAVEYSDGRKATGKLEVKEGQTTTQTIKI